MAKLLSRTLDTVTVNGESRTEAYGICTNGMLVKDPKFAEIFALSNDIEPALNAATHTFTRLCKEQTDTILQYPYLQVADFQITRSHDDYSDASVEAWYVCNTKPKLESRELDLSGPRHKVEDVLDDLLGQLEEDCPLPKEDHRIISVTYRR